MVAVEDGGAWGTWEELILAGAVLRHGTQAWAAVSSELRARTLFPFSFTPQTCEAKYKLLRQQYLGCKALFEDLKKRRVEELKKELEKSDDSIGSLETKLENLKTEKEFHSQPESPTPVVKVEGVEFFGKDSSKDGLSAGSFTQDVTKITKTEISGVSDQEKTLTIKRGPKTANYKDEGLRWKRKRKDCNKESKEGSNGDSENVGSANVATSAIRSPSLNNLNIASPVIENDYLMTIFNSVAKTEVALVFRRKLDSQKRARYRKTIRRHVDFDTLRSKIANGAISSTKELFRDLLLLANNALVFYSKRTREYKTALLLRDIVTKSYQKHRWTWTTFRASSLFSPLPELCNLPVKPRSVRPRPQKLKLSTIVPVNETEISAEGAALKRCEETSSGDICAPGKSLVSNIASNICLNPSNEALVVEKKGVKKTGKVGRGSVNGQGKAVMNENRRSGRR